MAELNQIKKSKLIFDWKHGSILNCYTKSIGKFPKKVDHASFLQCSAYIALGQADDLRKIKSFMESQSKKNQVKHGKYGSIMPLTHFPSGSNNYQVLPLVTRGLLPQVLESIHKIYLLSTQHIIVRGSKTQQRMGRDYSNFTKRETFLVS